MGKNISALISYLESEIKEEWELILTDDGSKDGTRSIIESAAKSDARVKGLYHVRNFGQGRALRTAFEKCRGEIIVTMDADLSYGPEYIGLLIAELKKENVEIALASAYMEGGKVSNVPAHRLFLSKWGNLYLSFMSGRNVATSTCVVRAYRREVIDSMFLVADGMEMQLEILSKAIQLGFRMCEIPAHLCWNVPEPQATSVPARTSKMKIFRSVVLYLKMGWLDRPALPFLLFGAGSALFGLLLAFILFAISGGEPATARYVFWLAFASVAVVLGIVSLFFALVFHQAQYNYFDLCAMMDALTKKRPPSTEEHRKA